MKIKLQALSRIQHPDTILESKYVLKKFDKNSILAERTYFKFCYTFIQKKLWKKSIACLKNLESITKNTTVGGRSRYFLGWIYQKKLFDTDTALEWYKKAYLESPSNRYTFLSLKKLSSSNSNLQIPTNNKNKIKKWILNNFNNPDNMKAFFEKKIQNKSYAVEKFWINWNTALDKIEYNALPSEKKGMLLKILNFSNLAEKYFNGIKSPTRKLLLLQKLAELQGNIPQRYRYISQYLAKHNKSVDIFLCHVNALEWLYPIPYYNIVKKHTKKYNVNPANIYALMKQESSFEKDVRSFANAKGLMQIIPSTGRALNRKAKIKRLNLYNPKHSIQLGTMYFQQMSKRFNNQFEDIAIAYNAGPGRLSEWKKIYNPNQGILFWEIIPFEETYIYIDRTRRFFDRYNVLLEYYYFRKK